MIHSFSLLLGGVVCLWLLRPKRSIRKIHYLRTAIKASNSLPADDGGQIVDLQTLSNESFGKTVVVRVNNVKRQLGRFAATKIVAGTFIIVMVAYIVNIKYFKTNTIVVIFSSVLLGWFVCYFILQKKQRKIFEETFPDALNMLSSAVGSGESIMQAIIYVGRTLPGDVGLEFKRMGDRLQIGESPDLVFRRSCERFPYPPFYFFVITLRANMQRGGQLKDVIARLNRLMFDARSIDKKKYSLTAEARISAKIVAAIPFVVLFGLKFINPESFEFLFFSETGKPVLYYVITSEVVGLAIIWLLMRGTKK